MSGLLRKRLAQPGYGLGLLPPVFPEHFFLQRTLVRGMKFCTSVSCRNIQLYWIITRGVHIA